MEFKHRCDVNIIKSGNERFERTSCITTTITTTTNEIESKAFEESKAT